MRDAGHFVGGLLFERVGGWKYYKSRDGKSGGRRWQIDSHQ
jgi:hypothetical protein